MRFTSHRARLWLSRLLPSAGGGVFMLTLSTLVLAPSGEGLLADLSFGWHLRAGERFWDLGRVAGLDPFSYPQAGEPWIAWSWLYDLLAGALHRQFGRAGLVLLAALLVATLFGWLSALTLARCRHAGLTFTLVALTGMSCVIHLLARPHLCAWLLFLGLYRILEAGTGPAPRRLWALPPLFILWANVHATFIIGLLLLLVYVAVHLGLATLARAADSRRQAAERARHLAGWTAICLAGSLINPYGWRLHAHIVSFLRRSQLINSIGEYSSPDFHALPGRAFLLLLLLSVGLLAAGRPRPIDWALAATAALIGVPSARNVPFATILLCLIIAPLGPAALSALADLLARRPGWIPLAERLRPAAAREGAGALLPRPWPLLPGLNILLVSVAIAGGVLRHDEAAKNSPETAVDWLQAHDVRRDLFTSEQWASYLIYRLAPNFRSHFDDRFDLFTDAQQKNQEVLMACGKKAPELLRQESFRWVLMPPDACLSTLLRQDPDWRLQMEDDTLALFERRNQLGLGQ